MKNIQEIDNFTHIVSLKRIEREIEYEFYLKCSKNGLKELAEKLDVIEAKKATIKGSLKLQTPKQILLESNVIAKLIQSCSITLEPVVTNISKRVLRTFFVESNTNALAKKNVFELTEKSFDNETIIDSINLGDILMETISLETPDYPKKSGASIDLKPMESSDRENPFSVLIKLKK